MGCVATARVPFVLLLLLRALVFRPLSRVSSCAHAVLAMLSGRFEEQMFHFNTVARVASYQHDLAPDACEGMPSLELGWPGSSTCSSAAQAENAPLSAAVCRLSKARAHRQLAV